MKQKLTFMLLVLFCCLISCTKEGATYLPDAHPGEKRVYMVEVSNTEGKSIKGTEEVDVEGEEQLNGKRYIKSNVIYGGDIASLPEPFASIYSSNTIYSRLAEDGMYVIYKHPKIGDSGEHLEYPLPLVIGKSWTSQSYGNTVSSTVEGIESVDVPNGKYENCLKIHQREESKKVPGLITESIIYLAPKIGLIKEEAQIKSPSGKYTLTFKTSLAQYAH